MNFHDELDLLDQTQTEAGNEADRMELEGVDRRHFIFTSLITAAASTFGFGATALAQRSRAHPHHRRHAGPPHPHDGKGD